MMLIDDFFKQRKMYVGSNYPVPAGASIDSSLSDILLPDVSSTALQMEMGVKVFIVFGAEVHL